jgi:hypothetical protein
MNSRIEIDFFEAVEFFAGGSATAVAFNFPLADSEAALGS